MRKIIIHGQNSAINTNLILHWAKLRYQEGHNTYADSDNIWIELIIIHVTIQLNQIFWPCRIICIWIRKECFLLKTFPKTSIEVENLVQNWMQQSRKASSDAGESNNTWSEALRKVSHFAFTQVRVDGS